MTLSELLADVVRRLEDAHIAYMVTGSVASAFHGEPRATRDLDIVIDPGTETLAALVEGLLADGFYVDRDAAFIALRERTQFNAIGPDATKVDFIIRKHRPFSRDAPMAHASTSSAMTAELYAPPPIPVAPSDMTGEIRPKTLLSGSSR